MPEATTSTLKRNARQLRRQATPAEAILWLHLRDRRLSGYKFRRQVPLGSYILDFCCHDARLGVELDGGQHAETARSERDERRTWELARLGVRILRFWNDQALTATDTVLECIERELRLRRPQVGDRQETTNELENGSPHPDPLPEGEGEVRKDASDA